MVSLSKIKKLFFIILVLSFLTENDCYCMSWFRKKGRTEKKIGGKYNPPVQGKKEGKKGGVLSFFNKLIFGGNKKKEAKIGEIEEKNIRINDLRKFENHDYLELLNERINENEFLIPHKNDKKSEKELSKNLIEEEEDDEKKEKKKDDEKEGEEEEEYVYEEEEEEEDDSLVEATERKDEEILNNRRIEVNKIVSKDPKYSEQDLSKLLKENKSKNEENGKSINIKNDKENEKNSLFSSYNNSAYDNLFSSRNQEKRNNEELNRTFNEIKNGKKKNKSKRGKQKKMQGRSFSIDDFDETGQELLLEKIIKEERIKKEEKIKVASKNFVEDIFDKGIAKIKESERLKEQGKRFKKEAEEKIILSEKKSKNGKKGNSINLKNDKKMRKKKKIILVKNIIDTTGRKKRKACRKFRRKNVVKNIRRNSLNFSKVPLLESLKKDEQNLNNSFYLKNLEENTKTKLSTFVSARVNLKKISENHGETLKKANEKIFLISSKKRLLIRLEAARQQAKLKEEKERRRIFMFKTLRLFGFIAKPIGSLLWSYANSLYHLEDIELNKVYFCKYILCVGYRWKPKFILNFMNKFMPNFMNGKEFFFDININPISVIYSILCTYIKYEIVSHEHKVCAWKWFLAKSIFYTLPNLLNFNLNIKIKDIYFAFNFSGIIAELLDVIFLPIPKARRRVDGFYKNREDKTDDFFLLGKKEDSSNNNNNCVLNNNNTKYYNSSMNTYYNRSRNNINYNYNYSYINQQEMEAYTSKVKTSDKINNIGEFQNINNDIEESQNINNDKKDIISTKVVSE